MGIADVLACKKIGLDTSPFIYYIEENEKYIDLVDGIFEAVRSDETELQAVTSMVTLIEVLVKPIADGKEHLANRYRAFLLGSKGLSTFPLTELIAEQAATLRAKYRIRTPDSIQIATAIVVDAQKFVCNDNSLKKVTEIEIIMLDDML